MTTSEWPASIRRRNAFRSFATSSKCRPVVGSSNRKSEPRISLLPEEGWRAAPWGRRLREVPRELEPLRLAAGERRHRLAEPQVLQPDLDERLQSRDDVRLLREERDRLGDGQLEDVGDAAALPLDLEDLGPEALAVAVGAAQVHIREELHLDVLEAVAAAGRAAAVARVEAERARGVTALACRGRDGEPLADRVERADVARGVRARGLADRRLVDHHDRVDQVRAAQLAMRARGFGRLAFPLEERRVQHVLHERRFARARHAGHAHEPVERQRDVDALEVVLGRAEDLDVRGAGVRRLRREAAVRPLPAREVFGGERARGRQLPGRAEEDDLAAALARSRAHVQQPVGREHDLRVVLDDDERVARLAQPLHHVDHPAHVARVQPDRRLVQHEQRVDEGSAERGGEVDPLHLAAGQRARLPVEREIAEADFAEVRDPRAHLGEQQVGRLIQWRRKAQRLEERPAALDRQQHQVVHREARERRQRPSSNFAPRGMKRR